VIFRRHARVATAAAALLAALALPAAARAASSITIGHGFKPGVAVDAAGTAYIAWYEDDGGATTLRFCRLPRGAVACEDPDQITAPNSSLSRPFVTVSGSTVRIAQYRYPLSGAITAGVWEFTSTNRGDNFDAGHKIGSIPFNEAVQGPNDTISAATNAQGGGLAFQNMPLGGGSAGTDTAVLSSDHPYNGSVGLVNALTPLTVFSAGDSQSQFRRYDSSGFPVNDEANWTPATSIGYADYPRLAGGPTGLFLLAGTPSGGLEVRRYDGATFAAPVPLTASGDASEDHITQDASGRVHAVFGQGQADGLHLVHAVSDDGVSWRSGTVEVRTRGGIGQLRAAVAPDHVGVAAFEAGEGTSEIHVAAIGPDAPVDPAPPAAVPITTPPALTPPALKPKGRLPQKAGKAKRISRGRVRITLDGKLGRPAGVSAAQGCRGSIVATVRRGKKRIARESLPLTRSCRFHRVGVLSRKQVKQARKLSVTLRFTGNAALAGASRGYNVKLRQG
jgi:hypothetical protein